MNNWSLLLGRSCANRELSGFLKNYTSVEGKDGPYWYLRRMGYLRSENEKMHHTSHPSKVYSSAS